MALNRVSRIDDRLPIKNVLVSVSDKTGLKELVEGLVALNPKVRFFSTGGTYQTLQSLTDPSRVVSISDYTGQPEMQGGLVKTLDFKIYLGLLSETYNESHRQDVARCQAVEFDLVVVNLYPFEHAAAQAGSSLEDWRTHIDIGGPCMLRAGAKNFLRVAVLCEPSGYGAFLDACTKQQGATTLAQRLALSQTTFARIRDYDQAIASTLAQAAAAHLEVYHAGS